MKTLTMVAKRMTRRLPRKNALVRGEPVVRGVLEATLETLASDGYRGLRIEDVAARAGVNKTTVYRRWPTKEELVTAALQSLVDGELFTPSTGSLRTDLLMFAQSVADFMSSFVGRGIMGVIMAEGLDSELRSIARSLRKTHERIPRSIVDCAIARGDLTAVADGLMLIDLLTALLHHRIIVERESVDSYFLNRVLDLLLCGALPANRRR